jgi:hypothetical protein
MDSGVKVWTPSNWSRAGSPRSPTHALSGMSETPIAWGAGSVLVAGAHPAAKRPATMSESSTGTWTGQARVPRRPGSEEGYVASRCGPGPCLAASPIPTLGIASPGGRIGPAAGYTSRGELACQRRFHRRLKAPRDRRGRRLPHPAWAGSARAARCAAAAGRGRRCECARLPSADGLPYLGTLVRTAVQAARALAKDESADRSARSESHVSLPGEGLTARTRGI